jgi:hypothetical protein
VSLNDEPVEIKVKKLRPDEPTFDDTPLEENDSRLTQAYAWYRAKYKGDHKEWVTWLADYLEADGESESASIARNIPKGKIQQNLCIIARLLHRGVDLPVQTVSYFMDRIEEILEENEGVQHQGSGPQRVSPKEHLREKIGEVIAVIETHVDKHFDDQWYTFDLKEIFKEQNLKGVYAQAVYDFYLPKLKEILDAKKEDADEDLKYAYRNYDDTRINQLEDFLTNLCVSAYDWAKDHPTVKVRKARKKDPEKLAKKVKYLKVFVDESLNLTSQSPTKIHGADVVWLYNAKYRVLFYYVAAENHSLSIRGTTIINFDANKSMGKKLRKPKETLKAILDGGKVQARKTFEALPGSHHAGGRINEASLILRVSA